MALSERFHWVFRKLTSAFDAYDRTERSPDKVGELAQNRRRLEVARKDVRAVRVEEGTTLRERSSPRFVDPRIGMGSSSWVGRVTLVITVAALLFGLVALVRFVDFLEHGDLRLHELTETLEPNPDGSCTWLTTFELENSSGEAVTLHTVHLATSQRSPIQGRPVPEESGFERAELEPAASTGAQVVLRLDACPERSSDIRHGALGVTYSTVGPQQVVSYGI